jgi:ABC-type uncharacterized transport system auxiliary subunit
MSGGLRSAILLASLVLASCSTTQHIPEEQYYRLPEPLAHEAQDLDPAVLGLSPWTIAAFDAGGLYGGRAVVYAQAHEPLRLQRYHYKFWVKPPPELARDHLLAMLRLRDIQQTTLQGDRPAADQGHIDGRIVRFEQWLEGGRAEAIVQMELQYTFPSDAAPRLVRRYDVRRSAASTDLDQTAIAFAAALTEIYRAFLHQLALRLTESN